jgi:hypothetical protein
MHHHSDKDADSFATPHGQNVSSQINYARNSLKLNRLYGCAPRDLWVSRRPYRHEESIFSWLEEEMLPDVVSKSERSKAGKKSLIITNTGSIRFDIFKGAFTKDTMFLVSPFTSGLRYIKDVPYKAASRVLKLLNSEGPILDMLAENSVFLQPPELVAASLRPDMFSSSRDVLDSESLHQHGAQHPLSSDPDNLTPGYTTHDDAGSNGDDTLHSPIQFFNVPNCIQAAVNIEEEPDTVDLVYNEFIEKWIVMALVYLGEKYNTGTDTEEYFPGKPFTELMAGWVERHWGERAGGGEVCG